MPSGRLTKYNDEILSKLDEYIEMNLEDKKSFPTLQEFARYVGVNSDTIQEWKNVHETFSVSIKKLLDLQQERLMLNGLLQNFNPTMSIFLLKANHGMIETSRQELTGKDGEQLVGFNYLPPNDDNSDSKTNS